MSAWTCAFPFADRIGNALSESLLRELGNRFTQHLHVLRFGGGEDAVAKNVAMATSHFT
ncbi:hypothetical protein NT6N_13750 [Oceaniferula spumae]|uniref:Uncharacterized protein n=1 Tax=Oceaniferula spumae TaxID=2979115 RepID=A0AAT9FK23_9BACT